MQIYAAQIFCAIVLSRSAPYKKKANEECNDKWHNKSEYKSFINHLHELLKLNLHFFHEKLQKPLQIKVTFILTPSFIKENY